MVDRFVRYFKFTPEEEKYFRSLVLLEKDRASFSFLELLGKTKNHETTLQKRVLELFEFRLIAEWHHLSIRELFRLKGLKLDSKNLARLFKSSLSEETIQKSIGLLQGLSLIKKNSIGNWFAPDEQVLTQNEVSNDAIQSFHGQMLEQAKIRLQDTPLESREYQALTLLIDSKELPKIKQRLREFLQGLEEEFRPNQANQLYQIQLQLFPITRTLGKNYEIEKQNHKLSQLQQKRTGEKT